MAFSAFDAGSLTITFKATLDGSDLVPHKNIDLFCGKVVDFGAGAATTNTLRVAIASGGGGDASAANQTTIIGHVDGIETAIGSTNTKLDTLAGHVDGVESAIASTNTKLDTVAGHVDGVETLITSTNTKLDTVIGHVDGVETAIASTNTKLDTLAGYLDGVEGKLDTLARQPTGVKRLVSAAGSTNPDFAKASAGTLFEVIGYNAAASVRYLKIFNKASAPTVGTDTPVLTIPLPPAAAFAIDFPALPFATGIAFCLTTGVADADTGALTAADVVGLNILYA